MVWKKVVNADAGDADHFGGNDLDKVSDLFSGVAAVDTVDMNSDFTVRDSRFKARNPANTQSLTYANPPILAATSRTLPVVMTPFEYTICQIAGVTYCMKSDGTIIASDNTSKPELVIQAAIDAAEAAGGGDIYITGMGTATSYTLSSTFAGFTIGNDSGGVSSDVFEVRVTCAADAWFRLNNAFAGTFCTFTNATNHCGWYGGLIQQSTPNNLWTGFEFTSRTQAGCSHHTLEGTRWKGCLRGILLSNPGPDTQGYTQGLYFHNLLIWSPDIGIEFTQGTPYLSGQNGHNRDYFNNVIMLMNNRVVAGGATGVKNILGRANRFIECKVWDITGTPASDVSCSISADAEETWIEGGIMTYANFTDLGSRTVVNDMWYPFAVKKGLMYADVAKTANYTASIINDNVIRVDGTSSAFAITLPTAVGYPGRQFTIKRTDILASTNLITIATTSSQTIDGATAHYLWPAEFVIVESDGANWQVINRTTIDQSSYWIKGTTTDRRVTAGNMGLVGGGSTFLPSTTSPAANTLWALPLRVSRTTKFDTITFRVTTNSTAGNSRVGIYRDSGNAYPGALVFDSGAIDTSSGGGAAPLNKDTTITAGLQTFAPGLYWGVYEQDTATGQITVFGVIAALLGTLGNSSSYGAPIYGYSVAHTFGALPNPYTAAATALNASPSASAPVPAVSLRPI